MAPALVTGIDILEYQGYMLTVRVLKPATINRRLAAIRSWLAWEKQRGIISDLPHFPRNIAELKQAPRALEKLEESRFLRAVEREGDARYKAMVGLMLYAGLRVGETVKIRTQDVEISDRKGKIIVRSGKGMKRREVPLSVDARGMIRPWVDTINAPINLSHEIKKSEWLFKGLGDNHISVRAVQSMVKKFAYLAKLDTDKITPHSLRHTFATRLLRSGVDIVIVSALLGHSRLDTTALYTRPGWNDMEKAIEGAIQ